MNPHALFVALVALVAAAFTGCTPEPKTMPPIDARNIGAYNAWRSAAALQFRNEPWPEFDAAIQELRVKAMGAGATGSAGVAEALCKQINGRTFQEAMRDGFSAKMERVEVLRAELKRMVDENALIIPRDVASEFELNRRREEQKRQLRAAIADIASIRNRIRELGGKLEPLQPSATEAEPRALSRAEALVQIGIFMQGYREAALAAYGAWTIRLAIPEETLTSPVKEEYAAIRAAADKAGRTSMVISISDQLLIFDEIVTPLVLSPAITANLTDKDLKNLRAEWVRVRAEIWARKEAAQAAKTSTPRRPVQLIQPAAGTSKRVSPSRDTYPAPTNPGLSPSLVIPNSE